jgi:hypothetical protein
MFILAQSLRLIGVALGLGCLVAVLRSRSEQEPPTRMEARLVEADLAVHLLVFACRAVEARFIPLSTMQDVLTLLSLLVVGACRLSGTGLRRRLPLGRAVRAAWYLISAVAVALSMLGRTPPGMPSELTEVCMLW